MANGERGKKGPYEKSARRLLKIWGEGRPGASSQGSLNVDEADRFVVSARY